MGRERRLNFQDGIFHIISKAVEETNLFEEEEDYENFLKILKEEKENHKILLYSYCLMPNHYHLLLETFDSNLSDFMKILNFRYSLYYNFKYFRKGHLFSDRFKSYYINNEGYLLNVSRYIHLNPVEANIISNPEGYRWSSYIYYYLDENSLSSNLIDKNRFFELISLKRDSYVEYVNELLNYIRSNSESLLSIERNSVNSNNRVYSIEEVYNQIKKFLSNDLENKLLRNLVIYYFLNKNYCVSEISNFFNLSRIQIYRIGQKIDREIKRNPELTKFYNKIEMASLIYEE
ncbi:MAG: transposase [Caldisericia bacterium]|nr:transposase [Caldisericia bacterium]